MRGAARCGRSRARWPRPPPLRRRSRDLAAYARGSASSADRCWRRRCPVPRCRPDARLVGLERAIGDDLVLLQILKLRVAEISLVHEAGVREALDDELEQPGRNIRRAPKIPPSPDTKPLAAAKASSSPWMRFSRKRTSSIFCLMWRAASAFSAQCSSQVFETLIAASRAAMARATRW